MPVLWIYTRRQVEVMDGDLHEITKDKKVKKIEASMEEKQEFYSELLLHADMRGYRKGWAYWAYKDKFKVGPANTMSERRARSISPATESWIKSRNIRMAKAKEKAAGFGVSSR